MIKISWLLLSFLSVTNSYYYAYSYSTYQSLHQNITSTHRIVRMGELNLISVSLLLTQFLISLNYRDLNKSVNKIGKTVTNHIQTAPSSAQSPHHKQYRTRNAMLCAAVPSMKVKTAVSVSVKQYLRKQKPCTTAARSSAAIKNVVLSVAFCVLVVSSLCVQKRTRRPQTVRCLHSKLVIYRFQGLVY